MVKITFKKSIRFQVTQRKEAREDCAQCKQGRPQ
jgi:hypothetical protein